MFKLMDESTWPLWFRIWYKIHLIGQTKITLKKILPEGSEWPTGYGVTYDDYNSRKVIYYPIPLNLIIAWLRVIRIWLSCSIKARTLIHGLSSWDRGFDRGYRQGYANAQFEQRRKDYKESRHSMKETVAECKNHRNISFLRRILYRKQHEQSSSERNISSS